MKINCQETKFDEFERFRHDIQERLKNLDRQINQSIENERRFHEQTSKFLIDLDLLNPYLSQTSQRIDEYERNFKEMNTIEHFVQLHQHVQQIHDELKQFSQTKLEQLNEHILQYANDNIRHESTQLSTTLMTINNRYRILIQDATRFLERIDERIESETNNSIENYRKLMENLRVKLTRIRDDPRLTLDAKQRLIAVRRSHSLLLSLYF